MFFEGFLRLKTKTNKNKNKNKKINKKIDRFLFIQI